MKSIVDLQQQRKLYQKVKLQWNRLNRILKVSKAVELKLKSK